MKEAFRVDRAKKGDRDELVKLLVAQLREHDIATPESAVRIAVDGVLAMPSRGRLLVAKNGDETIGVAYVSFMWSLEHGGHSAWLEELYVVPGRRKGGVGTSLVHAAIGTAAADGCAALDLEIERGHERVAHLYEREKFTQHTRSRWVKKLR
jgi:GNAT superfamily N-acetyltransferase